MKLLHGTNLEAAESIIKNGVDMFHPRKKDPGDFGMGFYLTSSLIRANVNGHSILEVDLDVSKFAFIADPYNPDTSTMAQVFKSLAFNDKDEMLTCVHSVRFEERREVCMRIRNNFLTMGFQGIQTKHNGDETVVFDVASIKSIKIREKS